MRATLPAGAKRSTEGGLKLGLRREGGDVVIYREKWGALALGVVLGAFLTGFAVWFYSMGARDAPMLFVVPFCLAFGGAGLAILARLPIDARRWFAEDGAVTLRAGASGVDVAPLPGADPKQFPWSAVAEIALVRTLKSVESDETNYNWNALVVFLQSREAAGASWFELAKLGLGRTAEGRVYLLVSYPRKQAEETEAALRAVAPPAVKVSRYKTVIADHKKRLDHYEAD
ncbi:MAG: hypothetical protein CTY15_03620 [Methylocystis sp.]|nr:MAG: hypothetical protein CTY15_03620 [Methylocystis sp.]